MIDIGQMVRSANPVSGDSALTEEELDSLLHLIDTRRESMVVKERVTPVKPPASKRAPWLVAAAAFVVVLVVGSALLLALPGGDDGAPATPSETTAPPTPTTAPITTAPTTTIAPAAEESETAEEQSAASTTETTNAVPPDPTADQLAMAQQLIDARNSRDFDAWRSLLTPNADLAGPFNIRGLPTMGSEDIQVELDKVRNAMDFESVLNAEWTLGECRVADWSEAIDWSTTAAPDSGLPLSCELTYTDDFVKAVGEGEWDFEMIAVGSQGAVAAHEIQYRSAETAGDAWADFLIWVETQSLDDALVAGRIESGYRDMPWRGWVPKWTETSAAMVVQYLDSYLAAAG